MKNILVIVGIIIIIGFGYLAYTHKAAGPTGSNPVASASFICDGGKTIDAQFYDQRAEVILSDGRAMSLPQTMSADGGRYANSDESFVFWEKGNGALILENNQPVDYTGCIKIAADPGTLPNVYENATSGFSIRYPAGYAVDDQYRYQEMGPGKDITGVKFTVPASLAAGTNLGQDSYVSVEEIPQAKTCSAKLFLDDPLKVSTVTDAGTDYSVASTTGAGAGNRYEETVYAVPGTNPCIAIRYYIHYGVLENYDPGTVTAYDHGALVNAFDTVRRTLVISQ